MNNKHHTGLIALLASNLIWGLQPFFWKQLSHVDALQLLLQRTIWSLLFLLIIIGFQKRGNELIEILKKPSLIGVLTISTFVLALNWYHYGYTCIPGREETVLGPGER